MNLTLVVCKVFKRILKGAFLSFLSECNTITGCHHGFLFRRPCLSNVLILELCKKIRPMDQVLSDGKNLENVNGRCFFVRDTYQEWGTSGVSDWTFSILVICQRPPKCHQCANATFRRRRQDGVTIITKRPFAELPSQCLEVVGQFHRMQLYRYWAGSSSSIILCHWKSGQFHTGHQSCDRPGRSHGHFVLTLHQLQRGYLQSKTYAVYDKAVVR